MFEVLINKLRDILKANTKISIVYNFEASEFKGDPAAVITPSANESDYNTTQENIRVYAFSIRLFVKRNQPRVPEDADRILRDLVSSVIDDFDKYYTLSATGTDGSTTPEGAIVCPAGYTFINIFATPSSWGYSGREDEYRVAEILLRCRVSVDLRSIS